MYRIERKIESRDINNCRNIFSPSGEFISGSEKEKQRPAPVWEGRHTGWPPQQHLLLQGPPGVVATSLGQRWQTSGPRGRQKYRQARHWAPGLQAQVRQVWLGLWPCLLGPWAWEELPCWGQEGRGVRTPGCPDGSGGDFSGGGWVFPKSLEPGSHPWLGEGGGWPGPGGMADGCGWDRDR